VQSPEPRWHNRYACSRRRRTRGRRRDTNGSRVLVRPAGTGTRPPTARSYCCPHARRLSMSALPSPLTPKNTSPRLAHCAGRAIGPSPRTGRAITVASALRACAT